MFFLWSAREVEFEIAIHIRSGFVSLDRYWILTVKLTECCTLCRKFIVTCDSRLMWVWCRARETCSALGCVSYLSAEVLSVWPWALLRESHTGESMILLRFSECQDSLKVQWILRHSFRFKKKIDFHRFGRGLWWRAGIITTPFKASGGKIVDLHVPRGTRSGNRD